MSSKIISLNEKILVAGANGMVGSALSRALINHGYGQEINEGKLLTPGRNTLDFRDYGECYKWFALNQPTVVIISASKVGGIYANNSFPTDFLLDNLKIQNNLIELSWKFNVKRLLFLGSSCVYPKFANQPIVEESLLTASLEPTNQWYAIAKIAGIKLCEALRRQYGFDAISLMPTNLYGPGDNYNEKNSHVLPALLRKFWEAKKSSLKEVTCWGTGNPLREFLHVDDLAEACIFSLEKWSPNLSLRCSENQTNSLGWMNVGSGEEISIKDLANKISREIGFEGKINWDKSKPDGTPRKKLSSNRINQLGWKSQINIDMGIKNTLRAFNQEMSEDKIRL